MGAGAGVAKPTANYEQTRNDTGRPTTTNAAASEGLFHFFPSPFTSDESEIV